MQWPQAFIDLMLPMQNLYRTAIAELDDDQLSVLAADARLMLAQCSKDSAAGKPERTRHKGWLEEAQTARTIYAVHENRRGGGSFARQAAFPFDSAVHQKEEQEPGGRSPGKVLLFRPQLAAFAPGSHRGSKSE